MSGLSCCATELWFVLPTRCGSAASQPIPGVFPVSGDDLALCSAAAVLAPCSLVGTELCFQAAVTVLSPQPGKLERNKIIEFHLALELCFWAVSGAGTTPHLAEGSVVESWCSCCQQDCVLLGCWCCAEQPGWPSSVTHTSQPGPSPASQSLSR